MQKDSQTRQLLVQCAQNHHDKLHMCHTQRYKDVRTHVDFIRLKSHLWGLQPPRMRLGSVMKVQSASTQDVRKILSWIELESSTAQPMHVIQLHAHNFASCAILPNEDNASLFHRQ